MAQLPQTAYQSLLTPYAYFGLGRTNNYIENLFVGSTKHTAQHYINMEGVIPNSKVVIIPAVGEDGMWKRELYLRPGEWIVWVTLTVVGAMLVLAVIVGVLHLSEKASLDHSIFVIHVMTNMCMIAERGRNGKKTSFASYQFRRIVMVHTYMDPVNIFFISYTRN